MIYEWRDYNMTNGTISEKCETLYNKLNTFVTSVINRDVTPKISNLESDVTSLSDSITNLIQVQYIESGVKSINNGANVSVTHTVTACPSGYSWLWVQKESFRVSQAYVNLNGTTLSYNLYNYTGSNSSTCFVKGYLVFYPSTWNI